MRPGDTKTVVLSNLFVSLCTASLCVQSMILIGAEIEWNLAGLTFISTFFVYTFHRWMKLRKLKADEITMQQINTIEDLRAMSILAAIILIPLLASMEKIHFGIFAATGVVTLWYSFGLIKLKSNYLTLRRIPFAKVFLIAGVWTIMTVILPLMGHTDRDYLFLHAFERFFFVFSLTIPFDMRDEETDRKDGILTFPIVLGKKASLLLSIVVMAFFGICGILLYQQGLRTADAETMLILSGLFTSFFIYRSVKVSSGAYYSYVLEGMSLLQSALVALAILF